ncbi:beta-ketoacyl synthase N-terminal-like domain-containing protein, partial [Streptomyces sp. NPDC003006]
MLEDFRKVAEGVDFRPSRIPVVSDVTGELISDEDLCSADYWVRQVREPVRFYEGMRTLARERVGVCVEIGPGGGLAASGVECVADEAPEMVLIAAMRRDRGEVRTVVEAVAQAWVAGVPVDWKAFCPGRDGRSVELPTYAFRRRRFWVEADPGAEVTRAGLGAAEHGLLSAVVRLADGGGLVLSGRLSQRAQPWLADHTVGGAPLVPGTAFVELALRAGQETECRHLEELTLQSPLAVPGHGDLCVQVAVGAPEETGRRTVAVHSRAGDDEDGVWVTHAEGLLAPSGAAAPAACGDFAAWPPPGAEPVEVAGMYEELTARGYTYGPAFQSLRAAWRRGDEVFAEVSLPEAARSAAARPYGIHPALLDGALHAAAIGGILPADGTWLPFSWNGVTLHAAGATDIRVRLAPSGPDAMSVTIADTAGDPVAHAQSLILRSVGAQALSASEGQSPDTLLRLRWTPLDPLPAPAEPTTYVLRVDACQSGHGADDSPVAAFAEVLGQDADGSPAAPDLPDLVVLDCVSRAEGAPADRQGTDRALELTRQVRRFIEAWLNDTRFEAVRLAVLTRGAVGTGPEDTPQDFDAAPVWGLVRAAQTARPGAFALVDLDAATPAPDWPVLFAAMAWSDESQIAVRDGQPLVPRLARLGITTQDDVFAGAEDEPRDDATALLIGAPDARGAAVLRHVVAQRGVRHVFLATGDEHDEPLPAELEELADELRVLGADVVVEAATPMAFDARRRLLARIPAGSAPLTVIHAATGLRAALDTHRLVEELEEPADGDTVTAGRPVQLLLCSTDAAALGGGLEAAEAAGAGAFLAALAQRRAARGASATALALSSSGTVPDAVPEVLDSALAAGEPLVVAARMDFPRLRAQAAERTLPVLWRGLVRAPVRVAAQGAHATASDFARRMASVPEGEREHVLLELVRTHVAAVLGHGNLQDVDARRGFLDLGFDSLTAVELRNRLTVATGRRLPATLIFDYPTPVALAAHLHDGLGAGTTTRTASATPEANRTTRTDEPMAIVGMACRFPGGADSPEGLWRVATEGADVISAFPTDRGWDLAKLYDPDPGRIGTSYVREGGFVHEAGEFDAEFFGISPREALAMDPQQRLLLEVSWEALERADIDPQGLRGSRTGVFVGALGSDYVPDLEKEPRESEGFAMMGNSFSVLSGRVAYALGLEGPAVSVDTACSSSLVALHQACQALRDGDCTLALAGGVTILASPALLMGLSRQRALAEDGRCKAFAADADGLSTAEGLGVLVVERLSDARRLGHRVLAVVRGSAVNQDGASSGLAAPNGPSQQRVIRAALASAGLSPADVDAVEAHGTGTKLGDPIEAQALLATYGQERTGEPLWIGSVKSNIGHAQAAAGAASLIKTVMALRHGLLPKTLHVDEPTPAVDWTEGDVCLLTDHLPWPRTGRPRRAGVSSFGISGTNAHVILEQAPEERAAANQLPRSRPELPVVPWMLSARGEESLRGQAERLHQWATAAPGHDPVDVSAALSARAELTHRAVVLAADRPRLLDALEALSRGETVPGGVVTGAAASGRERPVLVFPGQGGQWLGMGWELFEGCEVFRECVLEV